MTAGESGIDTGAKSLVSAARRRLLISVATPLLAIVAFMSWGLSSPVGSSPDDDFHLASIWCGHGDADGCQTAAQPNERTVYRDLVIDSVCFAFNPDASASCQGKDFGENPSDVVTTPRGNFTGLYPPVFYFAMSFLAGPDIDASVLVMKAANSVLFVGLVTLLFWLLPVHRRPTLVAALALSLVPLGMSLVPSTNPSSWAIISAGTLWIALLGVFETTGKRRLALGAVATVATVIGAGARADSAIYAGLAVVLVLFMTFRKTREYFLLAIFPAALTLIAIALYLTSHQGDAATAGLGAAPTGKGTGPLTLILANIAYLPGLWSGVFGSWNLGWLDTALPLSVPAAALMCFAGAVFIGLTSHVPRKGIAVFAILGAMTVIPIVLLVQSNSVVGANYQPRYLLPLVVMLAGFLLLTAGRPLATTSAQRWLIVIGLSFANAVALQTNIRRYVTGADMPGLDLDAGAEWWWHLPISPMFVWIAGSLAFAAALVALNSMRWTATSAEPQFASGVRT
ncbi:MAG: DUF2142 domain-containing protein [Rhodoglobus sp.]